jgi:hypothetical protein
MVLDNRTSESLMFPPIYEEKSGNDDLVGHFGDQFSAFTSVLRALHPDGPSYARPAAEHGGPSGLQGYFHFSGRRGHELQREKSSH